MFIKKPLEPILNQKYLRKDETSDILDTFDAPMINISAVNPIGQSGDKITLIGKIFDDEIEGRNIDFYDGSIYLGTGKTNKYGIGIFDYICSGAGTKKITGKCGDIQSEIYEIEDYINYDSMLSESGKWSFDTGLTPTYSSDGMFLGNVSSGKTAKFNGSYNFPLTVDFDITSITTTTNSIAFEFKQTHNDNNTLFISLGRGIILNGNTINTGISQSSYTGHYQLKFTSATNCELYKDNTLITSVNDISVPNLQFMIWLSASRSVTIKNLKIKPLPFIHVDVDNSVLSFEDSTQANPQIATLTATISPAEQGQTVKIYKDNVLVSTETTDAQGQVSYEYESAGVGDVEFKFEWGDIVETYDITDALFFDNCSSDKSAKYSTILGTERIGYSNGVLTSTNGYGTQWLTFTPNNVVLNATDNWCFEAKIKQTNEASHLFHSLNLVQKDNRDNHISLCLYGTSFASYGYGEPNAYIIPNDTSMTSSVNNWYRLKCELKNGMIYIKIYDDNDVELYSNSATLPSNYANTDVYATFGGFFSNTTRQFKNILIKPLKTLDIDVDNPILSFADSTQANPHIATLTATVSPVEQGQTVKIYADNTLVATETTNSQGQVSYEYQSQGIGDVEFRFEYGSVIETYEIEDCDKYDITEHTHTSTSSSSTSVSIYEDYSFDFTNFEVSFDMKLSNDACGIYLEQTTNRNNFFGIGEGNGGVFRAYYNNGTGEISQNVGASDVNYHSCKIIKQDNNIKYYFDNNLVWNPTVTGMDVSRSPKYRSWSSNRTMYIKNVKIKKL